MDSAVSTVLYFKNNHAAYFTKIFQYYPISLGIKGLRAYFGYNACIFWLGPNSSALSSITLHLSVHSTSGFYPFLGPFMFPSTTRSSFRLQRESHPFADCRMDWEGLQQRPGDWLGNVIIMLERDSISLTCSSWGEWREGKFGKYLGFGGVRTW